MWLRLLLLAAAHVGAAGPTGSESAGTAAAAADDACAVGERVGVSEWAYSGMEGLGAKAWAGLGPGQVRKGYDSTCNRQRMCNGR